MGNANSLIKKKLKKGTDSSGDCKSKIFNCLKRNKMRSQKIEERDVGIIDQRKEMEKYVTSSFLDFYEKKKLSYPFGSKTSLVEKQLYLLDYLVDYRIDNSAAPRQLYLLFDMAQELRDTGIELSDKLLACILLRNSQHCYYWIKEHFESLSIDELTSEAVKRLILEDFKNHELYRMHAGITYGIA